MTSERSIPHLRDIFGINGYTAPPPNDAYHSPPPYKPQPPVDITSTRSSSKKRRDNNKTLTSGDVKTLERHLSMKKTIRKKIMRDLQQAFVDDPNEFQNTTPEQMKAELRTEAMRFGGDSNHSKKTDNNFLDMLRGENNRNNNCSNRDSMDYLANNHNSAQSREYDYDSPVGQGNEKQSFWKRFTMKSTKSKR